MPKRVVLSGYFGFKNFGDEAILSVLINRLQTNRHRITVISHNPLYTKSQYKHIRSVYTFNFTDIIGAIAKSDILISGGGSLLQDSTSFKSLIYYLMIIFIGILFRKKVVIFAQGIGPINNVLGILITKFLLKRCAYVSVRDKKSFELLDSWGIKSDLLCDPIFSLDVKNEKSGSVAVQLRDFKTMNNDFIDRLAQSINKHFHDKDIEIFSFQDEIDLSICQKFETQLRMLNPNINCKVLFNLSNKEIIDGISKAKYLIGMRFHSIIIGLLANCNIIAINYDIKVEKLSKEYNIPYIGLKKDFGNTFNNIYNQKERIINKKFNWEGLEKVLNT